MTLNEIKAKLMVIAEEPHWEMDDGDVVYDFCGGNVDDAYYGGTQCGRVWLARELLVDWPA